MNHEHRDHGENDTKSEPIEADECILWPEDPIVIAIEEVAMLL